MKQSKIFLRELYVLILVLSSMMSLQAESVKYLIENSGAVTLQIWSPDPGKNYRIDLRDVKTGQAVGSVRDFILQASESRSLLIGQWQPNVEKGIFEIELFKDSEKIELHSPGVIMPENFGLDNAEVDRRTSTIKWKTPMASIARVNAVLINGMKLDVIVPWHFTAPKQQSVEWNFKDRAKVRSYREDPQLQVYIQYVPLPDYIVVVGRPKFSDYASLPVFQKLALPEGDHEINMKAMAGEFKSVPELPGIQVPVVEEGSAFRVTLDKKTKRRMATTRYEIMFYADGEFMFEDSEGVDPYTFLLPALQRKSGLMYFSANLADYHGNSGTITIPVWYKSEFE